MPQLHLYIPDDLAERIQREAQSADMSVSRYLAELVRREMSPDWPEGYFDEVVGGWVGEALKRPPQGNLEQREPLEAER
ncbi:MAG: hypothetical protein KBF17_14380 [Candidatus Promineofilum sp.]|nr:hypothetical protein [Promineifilum sp.]